MLLSSNCTKKSMISKEVSLEMRVLSVGRTFKSFTFLPNNNEISSSIRWGYTSGFKIALMQKS